MLYKCFELEDIAVFIMAMSGWRSLVQRSLHSRQKKLDSCCVKFSAKVRPVKFIINLNLPAPSNGHRQRQRCSVDTIHCLVNHMGSRLWTYCMMVVMVEQLVDSKGPWSSLLTLWDRKQK